MTSRRLTNGEFLTQLAELFEARRGAEHGSVYLTQKRLLYDAENSAAEPVRQEDDLTDLIPPEKPLPILIRASDGLSKSSRLKPDRSRIKFSTIVQPEEQDQFFERYVEVAKAGMSGLKKRDRRKAKERKKAKAAPAKTEKQVGNP